MAELGYLKSNVWGKVAYDGLISCGLSAFLLQGFANCVRGGYDEGIGTTSSDETALRGDREKTGGVRRKLVVGERSRQELEGFITAESRESKGLCSWSASASCTVGIL